MTWYSFPALDLYVVPFPAGHTEEGVLLGAEGIVDLLVRLGVEDVKEGVLLRADEMLVGPEAEGVAD